MTEADSFEAITVRKDNGSIPSATGRVKRSRLITTVAVGVLGLAWKLFLLPISIIGGGVGLVTGSIGLSFRVAGSVLSNWLSMIGLSGSGYNRKPPSAPPVSSTAVEVSDFSLLRQFEGISSPEEMVTELQSVVEENAPSLFAASVDTNDEDANNPTLMEEQDTPCGTALETDQFEGPSSREEMVTELQLQIVLEENASGVDTNDEHTNNPPLMEGQDTQGNECKKQEVDQNEIEMEVESEANLREEALSSEPEPEPKLEPELELEPEPEPDVIEVSVRLPTGDRIERRFYCTETLQSVYEFVDSSGVLDIGSYNLVTFFPRVVYGQQQFSSTLKELGLVHPQTSLFVELDW